MHWSAEEFVLVITAFLFLGLVAASFLPGVELTSMSRATFAIGAAAFVGAAALLARIEAVHYPVLVWALPAVPLVILAVLIRDARHARRDSGTHSTRTSRTEHAHEPLVPLDPREIRESEHQREIRERAANPGASPQELASIAYAHPHVRATIAGNPAAPASLLEWLAAVGDTAVHAAISARAPVTTRPSLPA